MLKGRQKETLEIIIFCPCRGSRIIQYLTPGSLCSPGAIFYRSFGARHKGISFATEIN